MTAQAKTIIQVEVEAYAAPLYERGYSITSAAKELGCSAPHLTRILKGERPMTAEMQAKFDALPKRKLRVVAR